MGIKREKKRRKKVPYSLKVVSGVGAKWDFVAYKFPIHSQFSPHRLPIRLTMLPKQSARYFGVLVSFAPVDNHS